MQGGLACGGVWVQCLCPAKSGGKAAVWMSDPEASKAQLSCLLLQHHPVLVSVTQARVSQEKQRSGSAEQLPLSD